MNQADLEPVNLSAFSVPMPGSPVTALREFLAFKLGAEEYDSDRLRAMGLLAQTL